VYSSRQLESIGLSICNGNIDKQHRCVMLCLMQLHTSERETMALRSYLPRKHIKGIGHPNMNTLSSITHHHVIPKPLDFQLSSEYRWRYFYWSL